MATRRVPAILAIAFLAAPLAVLESACNRHPEQQFLTQFFRAARARDNNTLALMSAVAFEPRDKGTVEEFTIANVSEERKTPVNFKSLADAQRKANDDQVEFKKRKIEYQNANLPALETIVKLERDPKARMTPAQLKMKAEWDKWREDTSMHEKAVSAAKRAFSDQTGPAEASLTQPGQPPFVADQFQGELVSKDVTVDAQVKMPSGETTKKTLVLTLVKATGTLNGQPRDGRWIITKIQGA